MEANNTKSIGNWLADIHDETLCLPRFQRKVVWNKQKICRFLKTLILDSNTPVGIFLVLSTDPTQPAFPPRAIDESTPVPGVCNSLLLDGQQRLSALWKALRDEDEESRFYVQFNAQFEINDVKAVGKNAKRNQQLDQGPTREYKKSWFPIRLLNTLKDSAYVNDWLSDLDLKSLDLSDTKKIRQLIMETRKLFSKRKGGGKVIPYFLLPVSLDHKQAVDVYRRINTNLVKLSDHYLAVAEMEKETGESLYDMANRLVAKVPKIKDLETDEIGELILKISCLIQGKKLSGGSYKTLDFNQILSEEKRIFDGVEWAVRQLDELKIWHGKQLPSVIPLRVLPALHQDLPKQGKSLVEADRVVKKYLWHCFLTDRYEKQANVLLEEDFNHLKRFLSGTMTNESDIACFNKANHPLPSPDKLKSAGWPQSTNILSRGILLVCCNGGAPTLASNTLLDPASFSDREKHHIFPKSKLAQTTGHAGNYALNCLLIPKGENEKYKNELPGDYIGKLIDDLGVSKQQIVQSLTSHLIPKKSALCLLSITQAAIDKSSITLKDAYEDFIKKRALAVKKEIGKLLA